MDKTIRYVAMGQFISAVGATKQEAIELYRKRYCLCGTTNVALFVTNAPKEEIQVCQLTGKLLIPSAYFAEQTDVLTVISDGETF